MQFFQKLLQSNFTPRAFNLVNPYEILDELKTLENLHDNSFVRLHESEQDKLDFECFGNSEIVRQKLLPSNIPSIDIFKLCHVEVLGQGILNFKNKGVLIHPQLHQQNTLNNNKINSSILRFDKDGESISQIKYLKTIKISGLSLPLSRPGIKTYGHWLVDILPRLLILKSFGYSGQYIFPEMIPEFAYNFFNHLGISRDQVILYNPRSQSDLM